jgi:DNA-binding LytR/AlgR family response regulator
MKVKCLIVDDEPLATDIIESYIQKIEGLEVVEKCNNAVAAFEVLHQKHVDLVFLDIQMPALTGIDFLKTLSKMPKIIITTAYREYALQSYDFDVVDYLLKPISFERFLKAVNKYFQQNPGGNIIVSNSPDNSLMKDDAAIYVKENKKMVIVHLKDILYIESIKDYVKIYTATKSVITKQQISFIEQLLPAENFLRIHRSFIVAVAKIEAFSSNTVEIGKKELPIGRSYKNIVMNTLNVKSDLI